MADAGRGILIELSPAELELMRTLLTQYEELVASAGDDPALTRLFPVAYRDDPDAAAEFARYTRSGLVDSKTANAGAVAAALAGGELVELSPDAAERWLPVLTDLRLIVAERIGIRADDDPVPDDALGEVYHWLGQLQAYLIDAIEELA
ncbi:MAG: DUF2017 family protein [Microbacteriaceae bacterium]